MGWVWEIQPGPVGGGRGAEADDDRPWPAVGGDPQDQVDRAQQRVDRMPVGVLDGVREREERAVQDKRSVDREQGLGHASPECSDYRTVTAGPSTEPSAIR